ncbi:MAG: DUF58 domain-containing protein [Hyphomicrobiales bacterium]
MRYNIEYDKVPEYGQLDFVARQIVEGFITGMHKSPYHGFSVEFAEHRLYNTGESTRNIDWKLFAKTDKLFVKRYEEETNLRCHIVIDISSSMYFPQIDQPSVDNQNKITFSVYAAAAIMKLMKRQRDAVGLSFFADGIDLNTKAKTSQYHHNYLISELERLLPPQRSDKSLSTNAAESLHLLADMLHKRSLVVIFSDMFDDPSRHAEMLMALQHLKHNKHEVVLFHVVDEKLEIQFDYDNRPYKFVDLESKETIKVNPLELKSAYVRKMTEYKKMLYDKCMQYKIDFVEADINKGFTEILLNYLIKRSKLF